MNATDVNAEKLRIICFDRKKMSYREALKVEIVNIEDVGVEFEVSDDMIEFVPEETEFQQYDYIEEETQNFKLENVQLVIRDGSEEEVFMDIKSACDYNYYNVKDRIYRCSNVNCKREEIVFLHPDELEQHNVVHRMQIDQNECPVCNKVLGSRYKLGVHMETRHIKKEFICDNCGKIFRSKDNLRLHMTHHRKHFIVECRACKKTYKSMQSLRYHLRQHFEHHQCETCGSVFEHKKLLSGHIAAKHNKELMVQCRFCSRMFSRADTREAHEREIHKDGKIGSHFKCNICTCAFDFREDLMNHKLQTHYSGRIHSCMECNKQFKKKSLLDLHMNTHNEKQFECDACKTKFTFSTGLNKHKKMGRCKGPKYKSLKDLVSQEELASIAKKQLSEITVYPHKSNEIDVFSDIKEEEKPQLVMIMSDEKVKKKPGRKPKEVHDEVVQVVEYEAVVKTPKKKTPAVVITNLSKPVEEVVTSSSGRIIKRKFPQIIASYTIKHLVNLPKKTNMAYECDKCGKKYDSKNNLSAHLRNHLKEKKCPCYHCELTFKNLSSLRTHYATAHKESNPFKTKKYQCDECPKKYISRTILNTHKLSHKNLKDQKCLRCSFATNSPYDLKNHIKRMHDSTKDYPCSEKDCEKSFKRRCDMENHKKSVHSMMKIYVKCPQCEVIVLEKGLQSHIINRHSEKASYKPFVCSVCGKAERYLKVLQRHFESAHEPHDRGVIYPCPECDQQFFRRRELTAHSFDHFSGVVHACDRCGNKYKSKKELTNHVRTTIVVDHS